MNSVEAEGESIDAAIDGALKQLGVTRDRVEIDILRSASRGLFGIGGRKARVRATLRARIGIEAVSPAAAAPLQPSPPPRAPQPGPPPPHAPAPTDDALAARASEILRQIVAHLGVDASVGMRHEDDHVVLELTGDTSGVLIGRRGQMLDALEYIVNRIVTRDENAAARIIVDSQNYRTRRREALEELARRMGEQAKKKQRAVTLNPMSPRDRRIVHLILQADRSLTTKSSGKGFFRKLIIIPEGAAKPARDR